MKLYLGISSLAAVADAWTYNDFGQWATESATCASTVANQSPIDIATANPETTAAPLIFQGLPDSANTTQIKQQLVINDHTWDVDWDIDNRAEEVYGVQYQAEGGEMKIYKLHGFHFHSPSEHTIDGQHYDFEAHLVHACYGNITCQTQDENDELLVVSVLMNVGDAHPFLSSFWPTFQTLASGTGDGIMDRIANPYNNLVPPQPHDFYRYQGSTTTPSCVQNVEWFLMKTTATLSQDQLTQYRTAITNHPGTQTLTALTASAAPAGVNPNWDVSLGTNNREIQVTGDRVPALYQSPAELAQQQSDFLWHGVLIFVVLLAVALCCLLAFMQASKPKDKPKSTRAAKVPKKQPPAEEVPLVTPPAPPAPVPMLFTQPLQVPVTTFASPTPQLQMQPLAVQQTLAPQARPMFVAP
jgi:carbonic anhydrase